MADLDKLSKAELKDEAEDRGLPVYGNKDALRERIVAFDSVEAEELLADVDEAGAVDEAPVVETDLMESEVPAEVAVTDPHADARKHFLRAGSVSGEWIFDDIPGSIAAHTFEEALEKQTNTAGNYKVPGSHT